MGIKDNFSQAVKELWKKDGQSDSSAQQKGSQPTEIERIIEQQRANGAPVGEVNENGVPLETPYYPTNPPTNNNQTASGFQSNQQSQTAQPTVQSQSAQNMQSAASQQYQQPGVGSVSEAGGVNMNTQNVQNMGVENTVDPASMGGVNQNLQNMGLARDTQPSQDAGTPFGQPYNQPYNQNLRNIQQNFGSNSTPPESGFVPPSGGYVPPAGGSGGNYGGGYVPPASGGGIAAQMANETEEMTVISKNTAIDGNIRSLANMVIDGNIKGNVETTRNIDMSGKIVGDITCSNAAMNSAAMQGNISLKGRMKMDRDTILIGDLSSQYADINGRIRGKLDIVGKAELKRDAIVFGDINASTIAVTDGAIIQGYVNTTFLSKEDSRNVFPEAISLDNKDGKSNAAAAPGTQGT